MLELAPHERGHGLTAWLASRRGLWVLAVLAVALGGIPPCV